VRTALVGGMGGAHRQILVNAKKGAEVLVRCDSCKQMFRDLGARSATAGEQAPEFGDAEVM
jgi:hypothetical protein